MSSDAAPDIDAVKRYLTALQAEIVGRLAAIEHSAFRRDTWQRAEGGGGISLVIEAGGVFERGGVNYSHVAGRTLPPAATASRPDLAGRSWEAAGVSLVLHPLNPHVPTVHMNVRFFIARTGGAKPIWWFGGGMDLTPYYGYEEDARHFHGACRDALAPFGPECYPRYKRWCDDYFYLKHRSEPRGIGGIFYDDLNTPDFPSCFALQQSVGNHFFRAYLPILERRNGMAY